MVPGAPHEVLLVLDATTGQNGLEQARKFTETCGVTGIVLTKLDGTAKGGIVVAIARELNLPIRYVGVGETGRTTCCRSTPRSSSRRCSNNEPADYHAGGARPGRAGPGPDQSQSGGGRVLVRDGEVVGRGFHTWAGVKHAEMLALEEAGERARGATLYVNLEPCSHQGRTRPCADAVIAAGVRARGRGHGGSEPAGRRQGLRSGCARRASTWRSPREFTRRGRELNEPFVHFMRTGRPLVTLKAARDAGRQDRRAGRQPGLDHQRAARAHVQQLRHDSDAILTGIGTVLADDCLLTDRTGLERSRPLLRIVLDSQLRLPLDSQHGAELPRRPAGGDHLGRLAPSAAGRWKAAACRC